MGTLSALAIIKWLAIYLGPIAVVIAIYLKGLSAGKNAKQIEIDEAQRAQDVRVRAAEAKNEFLEKERYDKVENIRAAKPSDLLSLWSKGPWGPDAGAPDSPKKGD